MAMSGDFEFGFDQEEDKMPRFNKTYDYLLKKDEFLLTKNDLLIEESETDGEGELKEKVFAANVSQKTHFKGLSSAGGLMTDSQASLIDDSMISDSARGLLE